MANSSEILKHILRNRPNSLHTPVYQWLLPNARGLDDFLSILNEHEYRKEDAYPTPPPSPEPEQSPALNTSSQDPNAMPSAASGAAAIGKEGSPSGHTTSPVHEVSIFTAATESFTQKNTNCSIAESLERFKPIMTRGFENGMNVRAYISVALGCPYEGPNVDPQKVAELAVSLLEMGASEISVADTGMGTPLKTAELLKALEAAGIDKHDLALHFHDTYGQALVNSMVALEHGIRTFDSAVSGLGGCPFSPGATGNVATEDMVHCFHGLGLQTGVNLEKLSEVGDWISQQLGRANESRAGKANMARIRKEGR
jgi:hydroxymethylglutaryl-CoA lyase